MNQLILFLFCAYEICQAESQSFDQFPLCVIEAYEGGRYKEFIRLFTELNEKKTFVNCNSFGYLKVADSYFELGQYQDAISSYEYFVQIDPDSEFIPYVFYQIACAYFNQICGFNNDQIFTEMALNSYTKLVNQFPDSEYSCMARLRVGDCYNKLSGYEFSIGMFYYRKGSFFSASSYFLKIISTYPDSGYHRKALFYLAGCEQLIKEVATE